MKAIQKKHETQVLALVDLAVKTLQYTYPPQAIEHSERHATVSIHDMILHLLQSCQATVATLALTVIYLQRFQRAMRLNAFSLGDSTKSLVCPRRVFLAALITANKWHRDHGLRWNRHWEKRTGLTLLQINRVEMAFLDAIQFEVFVGKDTYDAFSKRVEADLLASRS